LLLVDKELAKCEVLEGKDAEMLEDSDSQDEMDWEEKLLDVRMYECSDWNAEPLDL
jgi:hypothetical protein